MRGLKQVIDLKRVVCSTGLSMDVDEEAAASSLKAYYHLLRDNRAFTVLFIGEVSLRIVGDETYKCHTLVAASDSPCPHADRR